MSKTTLLVFLAPLTLNGLKDELKLPDLSLQPAGIDLYQLTLHRGHSAIWIFHDQTVIDYLEEAELGKLKLILGDEPQSSFSIDKSRDAEGDWLLQEFLTAIPTKLIAAIDIGNGWESISI